MTNTPDLALIENTLKKEPMLRWLIDINIEITATPLEYQILYSFDRMVFCAYYNDRSLGDFTTREEAEEACQTHYDHFSFRQPEPFWKPIDECPKEVGVYYLTKSKNCIFAVYWDGHTWLDANLMVIHFDNHDTYFAEIPPCEVQS